MQDEEDFNAIIYRRTANDVQENVLENVLENIMETHASLAARFRVSERTIRRDLRTLQEEGFLRREGPDNGGRYVILY